MSTILRNPIAILLFSLCFVPVLAMAKGGATDEVNLPERYDCFVGARRVFSDHPVQGKGTFFCSQMHAPKGWEEATYSVAYEVAYDKQGLVRTGDIVDVTLQFWLANPVQGDNPSFTYDTLTAAYRFDCANSKQTVKSGVYRMRNQDVHKVPDGGMPIESVVPGSLSEEIAKKICVGANPRESFIKDHQEAYDPQFVCPETIPDEDTYKQQIQSSFERFAAKNPKATIADVTKARYENLVMHGCVQTLANLASNAKKGGGGSTP